MVKKNDPKGDATDTPNDPDLAEAWAFFRDFDIVDGKRQTGNHGQSQRRATVALALGYSLKTLDNWIEKGGPPPGRTGATKRILSVYRYLSKASGSYSHLASEVRKSLGISSSESNALQRYDGKYKCYRLGIKDPFIIGDISITNNDGKTPYMHYHSSEQSIQGERIKFEHQGPIFHVDGRMYFLGIGYDDIDRYFRPIIFKMVQNPRRQVTFGILLTEMYESYLPISAITALIHCEDERLASAEFLEDLKNALQTKSHNPHILYGTRVLPDRK